MQISIFGRTDKRACIYTLLKTLQPMGDVAVVTNNRHFMRLTEDGTLRLLSEHLDLRYGRNC